MFVQEVPAGGQLLPVERHRAPAGKPRLQLRGDLCRGLLLLQPRAPRRNRHAGRPRPHRGRGIGQHRPADRAARIGDGFVSPNTTAKAIGDYDAGNEAFTLYCVLCESVETPEDRSWVEFTLRDEARFSDGSPVTVEVGFRSPYGYATAEAIVEFDYHVRMVKTLVLKDRMSDEAGRADIRAVGRGLRALFLEPIRWERHLLREEGEGGVYDFSHDKVREVVYRDIGGARRKLLHRSVAEALEPALAELHVLDERRHVVDGADLLEHVDDGLVGSAVARAVEGGGGRGRAHVGVGVG